MALMPCGFSPTDEGVWGWLESRSIPVSRRNAAKLCSELGFTLGDTEALYQTSMGLSLNDSYWVVPRGFSGRFDEYNLYDNPFSEVIGALAVAGELRGASLHGNTPELTTDGTLRKGWRIIGGRRLLYKGSSEGCVPGEPWSEYVASLVGRDFGLDVVDYGIDTWRGRRARPARTSQPKKSRTSRLLLPRVPLTLQVFFGGAPGGEIAIWRSYATCWYSMRCYAIPIDTSPTSGFCATMRPVGRCGWLPSLTMGARSFLTLLTMTQISSCSKPSCMGPRLAVAASLSWFRGSWRAGSLT